MLSEYDPGDVVMVRTKTTSNLRRAVIWYREEVEHPARVPGLKQILYSVYLEVNPRYCWKAMESQIELKIGSFE